MTSFTDSVTIVDQNHKLDYLEFEQMIFLLAVEMQPSEKLHFLLVKNR